MNNFSVLGKFLDQPILVAKFQKSVPAILTAGALVYTAQDVLKTEKDKRKERALKTGITIGATIASALFAPHMASAITKRTQVPALHVLKNKNKEIVDTFVKNSDLDEKTIKILNKSKDKILGFKDVKTLFSNLKEKEGGIQLLEKLIPAPQNVNAKDIFSEIGYLSVYGAIPVVGGIVGGIASDRITDKEKWKEKIPDKVKEGSYQYLANIFMCNVGAGVALAVMEKMGIKSKSARAIGMTLGIILSGIVGGSKIANFFGKNVVDKIFCKDKDRKNPCCDILDIDFSKRTAQDYIKRQTFQPNIALKQKKERTPEILDIGLHVDDIATVSLLSGLKWIEPALPVMYTVSGYRAGIGYRN